MSNCDQCPFRNRSKVGSEGDPATCKYILLGEAPAYDEVRKGRPFVGATGKLLTAFLQRTGISRDECFITNAVLCQLPHNKKGLAEAIRCCRSRLLDELATINTGATLAVMGGIARDALYPGEKGGILASRGWRTFDGRETYVMSHPAYVLYNPNEAPLLLKDLQRLRRGRQEAPEVEYVLLNTKELLEEFIASLHRVPMEERGYLAYDLETDQVDFQRDRILCMSISAESGTAYIIPDSLLYQDGHEFVTTRWTKKQFEAFLRDPRYRTGSYLKPNWNTVALLRELFSIMGYKWVAHNSKFDMRFLRHLGVENVRCDFDTIVAHYTLDERKGGHGLKPLADDYFDSGDYESELFQYIAKKSGHYSRVPREVLYRYNAMDTELTLRLAHTLEAELREQRLYNRPFLFPMMAAVPMLLDAELEGVGIDWEEFQRVDTAELMPELEWLKGLLREISGHEDLNPLSSKRVNDILYDELNFPIIKVRTRAAGKRLEARSSQRAVLDGWAKMWQKGTLHVSEQAWKFAETLRQYRHIRKMQGSYVRKWPRFKGTDERVHTSFLLRGTVTGRLSSIDPPLQTIPSKVTDKWGPLIANAHVPRPGWKFLYADYSQAELMAAACMSSDEFMLSTFRKKDVDYHGEVALAAFGENFTRDERQACKRLTFGWLYGGNAYQIALDALQFEGPVAKRFAKEWDDLFKGVVAWRKLQGDLMQKQGYVQSVFGRRRRYLLLTSRNVGKAKRVAVNAPIQSAVSDLTLISAIRLHKAYQHMDYANVVLLIHDSLIMEVRDDHVEEVKKTMHDIMLDVPREVFPQIQFQAEVKIGSRLGDLT